jgi:hypothetical protein
LNQEVFMNDVASHEPASHETSGYDIAVSFADAEQSYVAQVVEACRERGMSVLFERDRTNDWWRRNVSGANGTHVRYFVPFVAADEFSSAMLAAVKAGDGYVLPVLTGDTPADLLHPHVDYLRREGHSADQLADLLVDKIDQATSTGQQPRAVGEVVKHALHSHQPATKEFVRDDFSKYEAQQTALHYLGDQFQVAAPQLRTRGFVCTVHRTDSAIAIRVERRGDTVYALDIRRGGIGGDETLNFVVGLHDAGAICSSGWARPVFEGETGTTKLELHDLSVFGTDDPETRAYTKEGLFVDLWQRIGTLLDQQVAH